MTYASTLFRLQQTDLSIDKIQNHLDKIQSVLNDDHELREIRNNLLENNRALSDAQAQLNEVENVVDEQRIKIEQLESSLYSGRVHLPKELQELQQDVASSKLFLQVLEDRQLEAMLKLEKNQEGHNFLTENQKNIKVRIMQQNQSLEGEQEILQKELEKMNSERNALIEGVSAELLAKYNYLRTSHRGVAVAAVIENSCSACGSSLTPALAQTARYANDQIYCPACGRILYSG